MKYRVKVQKYKDGSIVYTPEMKAWWHGWSPVPTLRKIRDVFDAMDNIERYIAYKEGNKKDGRPSFISYEKE